MTIKAILFDMDGVLIDAKEWHYSALNRALSHFGMPISRTDHVAKFDGLPTRKKLEMLGSEHDLPPQLHEFINELKQNYTLEIVTAKCRPNFTHEFALSRLKSMGYKMAVCSNSVRASVDRMIEAARLTEYLDLTLSNEDVRKSKPDPEIYSRAIAHFGFAPGECLIVEDNENGIAAARASGGHVLEVETVEEVNFRNIRQRIAQIEQGAGA